jgi:limonene-1,2-epoxide hydrolase
VAFFFGIAAISDRSGRTLGVALDRDKELKVRVSAGWLYAAALSAGIGYVFTLRSIAGDDQAQGEALALPMLFGALALTASGVASKFLRPEFRLHLYLMSLIAALVSIATSGDAGTLALVLTIYVGAYALIAVIEDTPAIAAPSVVFGYIAAAAWRAHLDGSFAALPIAYSFAGVAAYCAAFALKDRLPRWSMALRATGAAYALVAPAAGFGMLTGRVENGAVAGDEFARTALYQFSTLAVAAVGVLALVESLIARRRWIIVPASAVLTVALLLQIGRFEPENPQVYTAVIGSYLALLGIVGLSRLKLVPALSDFAVYIEALGAATVMLPSFVQSFDAGWRYQWILLIEAAMFLTAGIGLRRRGILSAGVLFMVLVAGRALFDAINAMPNWIVVALCGIGLLGIGMGILLGRERWDKWQRTVVSWWENGDGALAG